MPRRPAARSSQRERQQRTQRPGRRSSSTTMMANHQRQRQRHHHHQLQRRAALCRRPAAPPPTAAARDRLLQTSSSTGGRRRRARFDLQRAGTLAAWRKTVAAVAVLTSSQPAGFCAAVRRPVSGTAHELSAGNTAPWWRVGAPPPHPARLRRTLAGPVAPGAAPAPRRRPQLEQRPPVLSAYRTRTVSAERPATS